MTAVPHRSATTRGAASVLLAALPCLLACFLAQGPVPARAQDPHEFTDVGCVHCHREGDQESASGAEDLREDLDARCAACHAGCVHGRKHRGSRANPRAMGVPLPLAGEDRMACHTCHDPHAPYLDTRSGGKTRYLRMDNARRELCLSCHRS